MLLTVPLPLLPIDPRLAYSACLVILQEFEFPMSGMARTAYDYGVLAVLLIVITLKGIEKARMWGLLTDSGGESNSNDQPNGRERLYIKTVGKMSVETFDAHLRHEVRDQINAMTVRLDQNNREVLQTLGEINRGIEKLITIQELLIQTGQAGKGAHK